MGSNLQGGEQPAHPVTFAAPFHMSATEVTGLVIEYMRKMLSVRMGFWPAASITPTAAKCAILPWRATTVTTPGASPALHRFFIAGAMRASFSAESPTSKGSTVATGLCNTWRAKAASRR